MVGIAVVPTLTVRQSPLGGLPEATPTYLRPPIMAAMAVPIVVYLLMPLRRFSARLVKQ